MSIIQNLQTPGAYSGNATTMPQSINTPTIPSTLAPSPSPSSTSSTPSNSSGLGSAIASKISQAQQQYPGQDQAILDAFIRDNQTAHPDLVQKIQGLMGKGPAANNNNPTNMTTDVATSLGLTPGKDFTQGGSFEDGQGNKLYYASLKGDPVQTTINAFDKAAADGTPIFQTASGGKRWSYIDMSNQQWQTKTLAEKEQIIAEMKNKGEGASGYSPTQILNSLVADNTPNTSQTPPPANPQSQITGPLKKIIPGAANALKNTGVGLVKGVGNLENKTAGKLGDLISKLLGAKTNTQGQTSGEQLAQQNFTPKGTSQGVGNVVGEYVLPALAAALPSGGAASELTGVDIPSVLGKAVSGVKTVGNVAYKVGLIGTLIKIASELGGNNGGLGGLINSIKNTAGTIGEITK